jgi:hydroxymethylglutaryl-CoA lyase
MSKAAEVTVREVGPRDGLQSLGARIPTEQKVRLIDALSASGLPRIEVTSFVHPRYVPQMADAAEVIQGIRRRPGASYEALVPNLAGAQCALERNVDALLFVLAASETFNTKNVRMSVAESLAQLDGIARLAREAGTRLVGCVATAFGCPYEGEVPEDRLVELVDALSALRVDELFLADTTGMANPAQVERVANRVRERWPDLPLGLHFHNTRGMGLANVLAGLQAGVRTFDASVGGLGGCPFAPAATGNICTEDTVHMLEEMGHQTGVDLEALLEAARLVQTLVERELPGQILKAGPRWRLHPA